MVTKFAQKRFAVARDRRKRFLEDTELCRKVRENVPSSQRDVDPAFEPGLFFTFLEEQCFDTFTDMLPCYAPR